MTKCPKITLSEQIALWSVECRAVHFLLEGCFDFIEYWDYLLMEHPLFCVLFIIRTTFGYRWVGALGTDGCWKWRRGKGARLENAFICPLCSNLMVGGWVRINPNIVRIVKSAQNNGRSLTDWVDTWYSSLLPFGLGTIMGIDRCRAILNIP